MTQVYNEDRKDLFADTTLLPLKTLRTKMVKNFKPPH